VMGLALNRPMNWNSSQCSFAFLVGVAGDTLLGRR
jgi:hypothetical protein